MFDITALGEILIDFTPSEQNGGKYCKNAGGAPANVLATISKYGGHTAFIGKVGNDQYGKFLIDTLKGLDVDTSGIAVDHIHHTTFAFVDIDENGDRSFRFDRASGADIFLNKEDISADSIRNSGIFHFGSLSLTDEPSKSAADYALGIAKESGCIISFDPNYRALLWENEETAVRTILDYIKYADIMKVSREEAAMLSGTDNMEKAAEKLTAMGIKILLITDGASGVTYRYGNDIGFVPAISVKAIDTTGAGDIFFGTFLYELIRSGKKMEGVTKIDIENFIGHATITSGMSTLKSGAIPSIPDYSVIKTI